MKKQQSPHKIDADYIKKQRWFQHKSSIITSVELYDEVKISEKIYLSFYEIAFEDIDNKIYLIPTITDGSSRQDASVNPEFVKLLFTLLAGSRNLYGNEDMLNADKIGKWEFEPSKYNFKVIETDASNTHIICLEGERPVFFLKLLRRLRAGNNVEAEVNAFLSENGSFKNAPRMMARAAYSDGGKKYHMATLFDYVENKGSGWDWTVEWLKNYLQSNDGDTAEFNLKMEELGRILAKLHVALSSGKNGPFRTMDVADTDLHTWQSDLTLQMDTTFSLIEKSGTGDFELNKIASKKGLVKEIIDSSPEIFKKLGKKIRQHADFHLGQVVLVGDTFYIIDFEGEPLKPYDKRSVHYPALKDVAGMMRSLNYAYFAAFFNIRNNIPEEKRQNIVEKGKRWEKASRKAFLDGYFRELRENHADFLPLDNMDVINKALSILTLEKALYEVEYEINNRPEWLLIPLGGVLDILENFYEGALFYK